MAPKKQSNGEAAGSPDLTLSESEAKLIASILKHSPASCKLKPNWEAVRQDVESASTESVNRRYLLMSKYLHFVVVLSIKKTEKCCQGG